MSHLTNCSMLYQYMSYFINCAINTYHFLAHGYRVDLPACPYGTEAEGLGQFLLRATEQLGRGGQGGTGEGYRAPDRTREKG